MTEQDTPTIKHRNVIAIFILFHVTLGIYGLYWLYMTSSELMRYNRRDGNPLAWLIMALIPVLNVFAIWLHAVEVEKFSKQDGNEGMGATFLFVLWLAPPIAMMFIQGELNTRAVRKSSARQHAIAQ